MASNRRPPAYVVSPHPGLLVRGNIDIMNRPAVRNANGTISSVRSVSFNIPFPGRRKGAEVLIPTVVGNKVVSDRAAFDNYRSTGRHLGIFDTPSHATAYANVLHLQQARLARSGVR